MRFFGLGGNKNEQSDAAKAHQEASQRSLQAGGLPLNAIERLQEQASRQNTSGHIFTSDFSVNELALARQMGYEPLGQVMGSSVYHCQGLPYWVRTEESAELTQAYHDARHLAIGRLRQEATLLGATGVVGVRIDKKDYEWGPGLLEFTAIGTAVRQIGVPPNPDRSPFLSALSGEEFFALHQTGYQPVGLPLGNSVYCCVPNYQTRRALASGWQNQELDDFTQAVYNARSLAMGRMQEEARQVNAAGIVGVHLDMDTELFSVTMRDTGTESEGMLVFFVAYGTAVAWGGERAPQLSVEYNVSMAD